MKYLITFIIFTTLFLLAPFSLNAYAQTSKAKSPDKEQLEVQKFIDSFNKTFEETKDLGQIPKSFFVADFKTRFAKNYEWFEPLECSEFFKQLSQSERYDGNVLFINFFYLGMMSTGEKNFDFGSDEDSYDALDANKLYPKEIADSMKESKFLKSIFDDDDFEIKNIIELNQFIADLKKVSEVKRKYLNENKTKWESNYAKNITEARSQFAWYQTKLCEKEECANLPQKTKIVYYASFPFLYSIIKENNELRIFDIGILGN